MPTLPKQLNRPTLAMLPRAIDNLAFVYVNRARIERDDNGVHAIFRTEERGVERVYLPTASIAVLLLGSGTSITQPAAALALRDGSVIVLSGEAGALHHGSIAHNDLTTRWLHLQAAQWANPATREECARRLYALRFDTPELAADKTIDQLRGMEGHRVKTAYQTLARQHRIPFRRVYNPKDFNDADPANQSLTAANHILYGIAHSAIVALGASPALGFIHTGHQRSFVYDIADIYKLQTTVPAAFAAAKHPDPLDSVRRSMRKNWRTLRLARKIIADIQHVIDPEHPASRDLPDADADNVVQLWSPTQGPLPAGLNYADTDIG